MMRSLLLITSLMIALLCVPALAEPYDVIIIGAADSATGAAFEGRLKTLPQAKVARLDIPQLRKHAAIESGVVIWLQPEAALADREVAQRWSAIVRNNNIGLMIAGLRGDADSIWVLDVLRPRVNVQTTAPLGPQLEKARWIWGAAQVEDGAKVQLQSTFRLDALPPRAWLQLAADNRAAVTINGLRIGANDNWRQPSAFDVQHALRIGENRIQIDAENIDGPAGVIAALHGLNRDGTTAISVVTDDSWPGARVLAQFGGGPWGREINANHRPNEFELKPNGDVPIGAGLPDTLGRAVVPRGLVPGANATTLLKADDMPVAVAGNARAIVLAANPEQAGEHENALKSDAFAKFIRRAVLSLAERPLNQAD